MAGGQREQNGRRRQRPHRALLVPANHFLPAAFLQAEPVEEEDGELTGYEVTECGPSKYRAERGGRPLLWTRVDFERLTQVFEKFEQYYK